MQAFHLADALVLQIYQATRLFPKDEQFGLTSQLRRAAASIGANIVEGATRPSKTEYVRFLVVAHGSAREVEYELSIAIRLRYLKPEVAMHVAELSQRTCKALNGLVKALQ